MSGRRSRTKGKGYEREVANALKPVYPDARRGWQSRQGDDEADVEETPWWIECKVGAAPNVWGAFKQADAATDGRPVVCFIKRNSKGGGKAPEEFVAMRRETFLKLVGEE